MQQASGNWKLDADDGGGAGLALNSHSRVMLMAKLGETAGWLLSCSTCTVLAVYYCCYPDVVMFVGIKVPVPPTMPAAMMPSAQPAAQAVPPVGGTPSTCILICNMFDPATETGENWDEEIREDVLEECSKHGQVEHIKVEKVRPGGLVFVRFSAINAASKAANTLNGRFFAGRTIISTFLELGIYEDMAK